MLIWASVGAAAAGIVAVAVLARLRHSGVRGDLTNQLRDVQDVLSDCYRKIQEIEDHLPVVVSSLRPEATLRTVPQTAGNGTPVL